MSLLDQSKITIEEIADRERRAVTEHVRSIVDRVPITIHLHQPLFGGRLYDVGPDVSPDDLIFQSIAAGASGQFLREQQYVSSYQPKTERISQQDSASYSAQPAEIRRQQVALERSRYRSLVDWTSQEEPPVGAWLSHLSLSPPVLRVRAKNRRIPSLGCVYVLHGEEEPSSELKALLVQTANAVGRMVVRIRAKILLGEENFSCLKKLQHVDSKVRDELHLLSTKFILAHHWFFPYEPTALTALQALAEDNDLLQEAYSLHGWDVPKSLLGTTLNLAELLQNLSEDLLQLCHFLNPSLMRQRLSGTGRLGPSFFKHYLGSALCRLSGRLCRSFKGQRAEPIRTCEEIQYKYLLMRWPCYNAPISSEFEGEVPAFLVKALKDCLAPTKQTSLGAKASKHLLRQVAPGGMNEPEGRGRQTRRPDGRYSFPGRGRERLTKSTTSASDWLTWADRHARYLIEFDMLNINRK